MTSGIFSLLIEVLLWYSVCLFDCLAQPVWGRAHGFCSLIAAIDLAEIATCPRSSGLITQPQVRTEVFMFYDVCLMWQVRGVKYVMFVAHRVCVSE